jgi:hypothetical protein
MPETAITMTFFLLRHMKSWLSAPGILTDILVLTLLSILTVLLLT